ncbi:MarR family winged helix-turn-helix transcriptional regulator [Sinomonas sp.]|uniref:MarR family winged helix-turn-helix transcriptional regulator n=1 Tax=Sinomonas sp. TaxID=1914986 RepID=UPI002FDFA126
MAPIASQAEGSGVYDEVEAVLRASRALLGVVARSVAEALESVTLPQFRVLVVLASSGPVPIGILAAKLGSVPSTFSRFLDRMQEAGLVTRQPSPDSRREVLIALQPRGAAIVEEATERRRLAIGEILEGLDRTERAAIVAAMDEFSAGARAPAPETLLILGL